MRGICFFRSFWRLVAARAILALSAVGLIHILAPRGILVGTVGGSLHIFGGFLLCPCPVAIAATIDFFHNIVSFLLLIVCCCYSQPFTRNRCDSNSLICHRVCPGERFLYMDLLEREEMECKRADFFRWYIIFWARGVPPPRNWQRGLRSLSGRFIGMCWCISMNGISC